MAKLVASGVGSIRDDSIRARNARKSVINQFDPSIINKMMDKLKVVDSEGSSTSKDSEFSKDIKEQDLAKKEKRFNKMIEALDKDPAERSEYDITQIFEYIKNVKL